ncbi:MAG TPA: DUF3426 domain-containing protein [Steroidobacteraceae bacterium]|nr:DUF3426 domain-containing protein [Steroidobacteraceae bacterium]
MYTQCPQCQTVFRVTAAMLKAAKGRVRCGRCAHVFDALTFLIDIDEAATDTATPAVEAQIEADEFEIELNADPGAELAADAPDVETPDVPEAALEFTADDLSKVFVVAPAPTLRPLPVAQVTTVPTTSDEDTAEHEILDIELEGEAGPEVITLEGDSVVLGEEDPSVASEYFVELDPQTGEELLLEKSEGGQRSAVRDEHVELAPEAGTTPTPVTKIRRNPDAIDAEVQREIEAAFAADPTTRAEFTLPSGKRIELGRAAPDPPPPLEDDDDHAERLHDAQLRRKRVTLGWAIASGVLGLTLTMQLVHHNRQALARNSWFGPAVTGLYGVFGSELEPRWNVHAYELRQFGASADAGTEGTLRVRASLLNGAVHAQPYPVLRLTLQDRFGGQVGLRDLEPGEYLRAAPARNALIGAGQRVDADIAIVDPGQDAVGFEIDVCLRATPQGLTCANDIARNSG